MKSQIQDKRNSGIVELLIQILNKIIRNQSAYFVIIMNNRLEITSVHGAPLESMGEFKKKKKLLMGKKIMRSLF